MAKEKSHKPPFIITSKILKLYGDIQGLIGQIQGHNIVDISPKLRKINTIKTIQSTCAIEGNTLSFDQITDILDGKKVSGAKNEILEVKNALKLYDQKNQFSHLKENDLLKAHQILMNQLLENPGEYRNGGVEVMDGEKVVHMAPPAMHVSKLMKDLFSWMNQDDETNLIIQSAIFHFELEFIHPFFDGNGRMGRFWQYLILIQVHPIFKYVPVESIIHENQQEYYKALQQSQRHGDSTVFIEFSLFTIHQALLSLFKTLGSQKKNSSENRIKSYLLNCELQQFSRKDYLKQYPSLAPLSASRDLALGLKLGLIKKIGDKRLTKYEKI